MNSNHWIWWVLAGVVGFALWQRMTGQPGLFNPNPAGAVAAPGGVVDFFNSTGKPITGGMLMPGHDDPNPSGGLTDQTAGNPMIGQKQ